MNLQEIFHPSWHFLLPLLHQEPLLTLNTHILPNSLYYPPKESIFKVFRMPLDNIKVVILGQDPYPGPKQATGLAFGVDSAISTPPSLKIIAQEIEKEGLKSGFFDSDIPEWKTLEHWEEQGVFLLNTALTVESSKPASHSKYWEEFTKKVIFYIATNHPCIWLLWGTHAKGYMANMPSKSILNVTGYTPEIINQIPSSPYYNYVLKSAHPAAEVYKTNAGFLGNNHFVFANTILSKLDKEKINW